MPQKQELDADGLPRDGYERIIALLKLPEFKELADAADYVIRFENGKHVKTVRLHSQRGKQ